MLFEDKTGQSFGRLTVLSEAPRKKNRRRWNCLCSCGTFLIVAGNHLTATGTKSCGCLNQETRSKTHTKDLTGQIFGRLQVIKRYGYGSKNKHVRWECLCSCGNTKIISSNALTRGHTKSCTCLQREKGPNCPRWKGGVATTNKKIRTSSEYKNWRTTVLERDNYTCQSCGQEGGNLHVHHIKTFTAYPILRFDINNAYTLCVTCHKQTPTYGNHVVITNAP